MTQEFDLKGIGQRMRLIRDRLHKTQAEMAADLGISLSHYSKLEVGIGGMGHGLIYTFCQAYNIDQPWFVYGKGEEPTYINPAPKENPNEVTDDLLTQVVEMVLNPEVQKMAENFSKSFKVDQVAAMTMMVKELLKAQENRRLETVRQQQIEARNAELEFQAEQARKLQERILNGEDPEPMPPKRPRGRPRTKNL